MEIVYVYMYRDGWSVGKETLVRELEEVDRWWGGGGSCGGCLLVWCVRTAKSENGWPDQE